MKIGELAKAAGVKATTLRFYERRGILTSRRTRNGYRAYAEGDVQRVRFVRSAQALGFGLEEIKRVLAMADRLGTASPAALAALAHAKLAEIDEKRRALLRLKRGIERLLAEGRAEGSPCPVLTALEPCGPRG